MDSSSDYCTLELELVNEYNAQVQCGTWGVDAGLSNRVKNKFENSLSYLFTLILLINYIVVYCVYFN